jgi:RNA polymerase sigma-70 factor (ECF subfamily)
MDDIQTWIESLYREAGPQLLSYLLQRAADRETAEDLLQETFAAALRHPERLRAAASPRAYLFGIARHLAASASRTLRLADPLPQELASAEPDWDPRIEWMREAIAQLKPEFTEALELRLRHELSYEEIADALAIPVGTVRSRLHHAVRELRRKLESHRNREGLKASYE